MFDWLTDGFGVVLGAGGSGEREGEEEVVFGGARDVLGGQEEEQVVLGRKE